MKAIKSALAAISALLAIYSVFGVVLRVTGTGRTAPLVAWNLLFQSLPRSFNQVINAVIFSIYPVVFVLSKRRANKDRKRVRYA
jgi:hypothetical protein